LAGALQARAVAEGKKDEAAFRRHMKRETGLMLKARAEPASDALWRNPQMGEGEDFSPKVRRALVQGRKSRGIDES
jgi:hypothetical protein